MNHDMSTEPVKPTPADAAQTRRGQAKKPQPGKPAEFQPGGPDERHERPAAATGFSLRDIMQVQRQVRHARIQGGEKNVPWIGFDGRDVANTREPAFTPLAGFLDGTVTMPKPNLAEAMPGKFLFYRGRVNEIHSEPGTGKTNALVECINRTLEDPAAIVLYIDPEDTAEAFCARALAFGGDPVALEGRVKYLEDPSLEEIRLAQLWANSVGVAAVVFDGVAEMMAAQGHDEDKPADCLRFFRENVKPFAEAGAAAILADHVTKSREGRGMWSRGSGAKMGHYNGVSYEIETGEEYTPTKAGFLKFKVCKDRCGGVGPKHSVPFELAFEPLGEGRTQTTWREAGAWRPTQLMQKIVEHLKFHGEANKTSLLELGNHTRIPLAIKFLIEDGAVEVDKTKKAHLYRLTNQ